MIFSVKLHVARVRHIEIQCIFCVHNNTALEKNALAELRLKKFQIEAFYSFFRSFIRSSLYPLLALQLVLLS